MTTIKTIFDQNQDGILKRMNVAISKLGKQHNKPIAIGENAYEDEIGDVIMTQAVEVSDAFSEVMTAVGVTLKPSLAELDKHFYDEDNRDDVEIQIVSEEATYEGTVGIGIMSKTLSLWTDATEWKEV